MRPVGIVGLGIVGGSLAAALEDAGVEVLGYDLHRRIGRPEDLGPAEVVFLCVPTPPEPDGSADLSAVWAAVETAAPHLRPGTVIAVKSTVPPGTSNRLAERFPEMEFASVPEFLVQERPLETIRNQDRVVIGARSGEAAAAVADLMSRVAPSAPVLVLRPVEAELAKLASNAMLAAKVAVANELAEVSRRFGVPWSRVQSAVGLDRRIGPSHLTVTPERGFGGACLPKDFDALIAASRHAGYDPVLLERIAEFNRAIRDEAANGRHPRAAGTAGEEAVS
ncbi:MAG: hypothetical protein M3245_00320 [Actinomycetota bacterium]|nr:hypothetical protein [Actinomycetota bacterium]